MTDADRRTRLIEAGAWLRAQRERRGISPADFAAAIGVNRGQISNYELGKNAVDDDRAEIIAEVLRMPVLEVRAGLGLWVPEDDEDEPEEMPAEQRARILAEIERLEARRTELMKILLEKEPGDRIA